MGIWAGVTPNADNLISGGRYLHAAGAGNLVIKDREGNTYTIVASAGSYHPFDSGFVLPSTTATGIVLIK